MLKSLIISLLLIFPRYFDAGSPSPTLNEPPEVVEQIEPQQVLVNEPFMFIVPVNDVFNDNGVLTYKASKTDQEILPLWLKFDEDEHTFYGQPLPEEVDIYNISLIATDSAGLSAYTYFLIEVIRAETTTSSDFFEDESSTVKEALISVFTILGSISSYIIIEAVAYARWRIKKNMEIEEAEDENPANLNLSCDNYRNDCCNGKFKCLSCYSFCDQCCQNFFSSACDACCKDCCKEADCNCCSGTYHPVNISQLEASSKNQPSTQSVVISGDISGNTGTISINNSKQENKVDNRQNITNIYQGFKDEESRLNDELQSKNQQINTLLSTIKSLLKSKDQGTIIELRNHLKDKDQQIENLRRQLEQKNASIQQKDDQRKDEQLDEQKEEISGVINLQDEIAILQKKVQIKKQKNSRKPLDEATKRKWWRAISANKEEDVKHILAHYVVDVNAKENDGYAPLHYTASWNSKEVAQILIQHGVDVNAKNNQGRTPLHRAAFWNNKEIALLLIREGAGINIKDNANQTPLDIAKESWYQDQEMIDLLKPKRRFF